MSIEATEETRINVRVRGPMAAHVQNIIGPQGMYESQSEYIRDLIRRDMGQNEDTRLSASIDRAIRDIEEGNYQKLDRKGSLARAKAYAASQDS